MSEQGVNEQLIETIKQAVRDHEAGEQTLSVWHNDAELCEWLRALLEERKTHAPHGRNYTNEQYVSLRNQLEQVKAERDDAKEYFRIKQDQVWALDKERESLRTELEQVKAELETCNIRLSASYSSSKSTWDAFRAEEIKVESLRSELSTKDKVLDFAKAILQIAFNGDADGGSIQDLGVKHGLLIEDRYDLEKHGESDVAEPGDQWFVFSPILSQYKGDPNEGN